MSHGFSDHHHHLHLMNKENVFGLPHEDATGLTRSFSQPHFSFKERPGYSGSPETTRGWPGHFPAPSLKTHEDAWNLIYTAEGQVARMKVNMSITDGEELFRQQHFCRNRCMAASAWPPRHQQNHGATAAKRGTGVFLPRRYCNNNPPESRKRQVTGCPAANLPARLIQSSIAPPQIQSQINASFVSHYEMLMSQRKAMISNAQQRQSYIHRGAMESAVNNPEVLLPQEWTY